MNNKILFDHSIFLHQKNGGISKYICELNKNINLDRKESLIFSPISINENLKNYKKNVINFFYFKNIPKFCTKIFYFINDILTLIYILFKKPDIVHLTYYNNFLAKFLNTPLILTVYDLIHEKQNIKSKVFYKNKLIKKAKKIVCISNNTKKDLLFYYNISKKKITVIYLGVKQKKKIKKYKKNFIIYVGARDGYKNFKNFILAYSKSEYLKKNYKVKCFGYKNFSSTEIDFFNKLKIQNNLEHLSGNEKILDNAYSDTSLLVYPSLQEGFGLPPLEAMRCGSPVAASKINCHKEILGDAVIYFNPKDVIDIKSKIERVLKSELLQKKLVKKGFKKIQNYKWTKCSKETIKIYKSIN